MGECDSSKDSGGLSGRGLVLTEPADSALEAVYARYLTSRCRAFFALEEHLPEAQRLTFQQIVAIVRNALRQRGTSMLACFAAPVVGTALSCAPFEDRMPALRERIARATQHLLPHLLLEMALRHVIPAGQITWPHAAPSLLSLTLPGEIHPPARADTLRFSSAAVAAWQGDQEIDRLDLSTEGIARASKQSSPERFRITHQVHAIASVTRFATVDYNPIANLEEHPEKRGNPVDLGSRSRDEWIESLTTSFALVERFLPAIHAEMTTLLQQAIPVGYDDHRHLSASYREAIGTIYLTLHPEIMTMTEAVIHEFQHNKLNVSSYSMDFMHNAFHPLYPSPVRPDPRPLWGILLAVHAFLPVAELYRQMRDANHPLASRPGFAERMSDIDLKNHEGMQMLRAHAHFTGEGRALMDDLEELEQQHLRDREGRGLTTTPTAVHLG